MNHNNLRCRKILALRARVSNRHDICGSCSYDSHNIVRYVNSYNQSALIRFSQGEMLFLQIVGLKSEIFFIEGMIL
jgi:hypothetical protein